MQKQITYCGNQVIVACDEKCNKAWGINGRPQNQLSEDADDYEYLTDNELPNAPIDPGTYEGGHAKPVDKIGIPNKWCVRECERCRFFDLAETIKLPDFSQRIKNIPA